MAIQQASSGTVPDSHTRAKILPRVRTLLARILLALGFAVVATWVLSRLITDRWIVSQFAFWIPTHLYLALATVLLGCERLVAVRSTAPRWRVPSWWLLLICVISTGVLGFRALASSSEAAARPGTITVVHWNMSAPDMLNFEGTLADFRSCRQADVILLGVTVPDAQLRRMVAGLGNEWTMRRLGVFGIVSRYPIERATLRELGLDNSGQRRAVPTFQDFYNDSIADRFGLARREFDLPDPGYAIDVVVTAPRGPFTIRLIDLPSNPFRGRMDIARHAAAKIASLVKEGILAGSPDVIIGDCNIPAGSASLKLLAGELVAAQAHCDSGDTRPTWPRALPLLRIDHAWVRPGTHVVNYRTFDARISDHRGQSLTLDADLSANSK